MWTLAWLQEGDAAVRYTTRRDLLGIEDPSEAERIAGDGDAAAILAARRPDGHWGRGFYQPKWTSTHYSLLELAGLEVPGDHAACAESAACCTSLIGTDGGVNPSGTVKSSDVCLNGMFLTYACHFGAPDRSLDSVVDFLLGQRMIDGGFNCRSNRARGVRASSVHTTASVIEGFAAYLTAGHRHRADEVRETLGTAIGCLLGRRLFFDRTSGKPLHESMTRLHYPARWYFDVLRGLEVIRLALPYAAPADRDGLAPALAVLHRRRRADGTWAAASGWPGQTHVTYPRAGTPNRWVTLRVLRVLAAFGEAG